MQTFSFLEQWTDEVTLQHTIKILQDSGLKNKEIEQELNLSEQILNNLSEKIVD